jgi:hypothetical protein
MDFGMESLAPMGGENFCPYKKVQAQIKNILVKTDRIFLKPVV